MEAKKDMEDVGRGRKHEGWFEPKGGCALLIVGINQITVRLR